MKESIKIHFDNPTDEWIMKIEEFLKGIDKSFVQVNASSEADISIDSPSEKLESEPNLLHIGGRISCPTAFVAANRLGMSRGDFGKFANLLNIKIFGCQLGCFK